MSKSKPVSFKIYADLSQIQKVLKVMTGFIQKNIKVKTTQIIKKCV